MSLKVRLTPLPEFEQTTPLRVLTLSRGYTVPDVQRVIDQATVARQPFPLLVKDGILPVIVQPWLYRTIAVLDTRVHDRFGGEEVS